MSILAHVAVVPSVLGNPKRTKVYAKPTIELYFADACPYLISQLQSYTGPPLRFTLGGSCFAEMATKTTTPRRIVFVHPDLGIGGAERLVIDAAVGLQSRGHQVTILTSYRDPNHCFEEARDGMSYQQQQQANRDGN